MTAKVVLLAEAVDAVETADEAGAVCAANVPSLIIYRIAGEVRDTTLGPASQRCSGTFGAVGVLYPLYPMASDHSIR
ncbi:MAG TPA: hypothetical protein VF213_09995, partial [Dongiaceae bacterium]